MSEQKTSWAEYHKARGAASTNTKAAPRLESDDLVARVTNAVKNKQEFVVHPSNPYVTLPLSVVYSALDEEVPREIGGRWEDYFRREAGLRECDCEGPCAPDCLSASPSQHIDVDTMNFTVNIDGDEMESLVDLVSQTGDDCDCSGWVFV